MFFVAKFAQKYNTAYIEDDSIGRAQGILYSIARPTVGLPTIYESINQEAVYRQNKRIRSPALASESAIRCRPIIAAARSA